MEKLIKLYTYVDGVHDTPFPNEESQAEVAAFRSDYKRMGGAPSISCTIMHHLCLDKMWTYNVYTTFNGEKFFIKQIPSSSFDNTNARYKHEVELVSERIVLDNVYFYDVVDEADYSKPVSNSTSFTFFGDIHEFAHRLNQSLKYSKVGYNVVVDDGISSEAKQVSFQDQVFSNVLQEAFNTYEIPYYFDGKTIHIGFTNNAITKTFKYGSDESLLSIQKQNANYKIVNRVTGVGSSDNIPYYYPNFDEKGVTRLLYNGEVGGVSVTNKTRYKKVKLGDTFVYDANPTITKELFNKKDYKLGYYSDLYTPEEEGLEPGFTRFQVQFSYSFYLNEMQQVRLDLNSLSDNSIRIDFTVVRQEGGYMEQFFDKNHFEGRLGQGTYNVLITWEFKDTMSPNAIQDWQMKEIIDRDFVAYGATTKQGYVSWMYNNAPVRLYDYGMEVNVEPNDGDKITFERVSYLQPQESLMPSIYRETNGENRFYNALNNTYVSPQTGEYYHFNNPYINGKPKEHIVNFEDIKPTIKGMTNSNGLRIDMFTEFAYDLNDNDEFDEEGNYLHPYFFGKLRRMDGAYGFNLFDHAIEEGEMVISMTSGACGSCEWIIGVSEDRQENIVQVDERGNLLRDANGNVIRSGSAQPQQNDTINNEVWIALKKDISTFGVVMPNANANYKPQAGDTFVILHIDLPQTYILDAENRLKEELIKYMATNNDEKFNFSISFSRIFFAENPDILAQLNENARLQIEYDGERYELYISSYSYSMSDGNPLPEIRVELTDTITISQNAIQTAIDSVKQDIMSSVGSIDFLKMGLAYFLRKDVDDRSKGKIASDKGIEVGNYVSGASGAIIYKDAENGQTVAEFDKLYVRMKAYFETLEIINVNTIGGKQIISPAGSVKCIGVEETDNAYRCYFLAEQDGEKIQNRFLVYDQIYSQMFDAVEGTSQNVSTHYFWRLCIAKSKEPVTFENKSCHYIDLSKTDCDKDSDVPMVGDVLNQRGNRTDLDRMNFIEQSAVDAFSPNITLFHGVNSYSLVGKEYVSYGVDKSTNKAFMNVYGDMYVGDRQNSSYMRYTQENGLEISGTLSVGTKLGDTPLKDLISASSPEGYQEFVEKVTQDIEGLQAQIDGAIETYFYQYDPTLDNYPASEWITEEQKKEHLNDTFTNLISGYSWRWTVDNGVYGWTEITDTATSKALALAGQAKDTADGKRRVFVDTPYPPYDKGDLWSRGSEYPLMICINAKDKNGIYEASDFDYADNNAKLKEEMQDLVNDTKDDLNNAIGQAKNEAVNNANAYTDEGKKALQASIDSMESTKANLDDVYTRAQADGKISETEAKALKAAEEEADAAIAYYDTIVKAYADGVATEEELKEIQGAKAALDAAKKYAEEQAQQAIDEANDTYGYLARALGTEVDGGLLLTSLIQMRDTDQNIMSGINGLTANGDKSIATWWGGGMYDMFDYYDWDGAKWVAKKNIQIPTNVPSGVIRMDGTGYLAKGKFWWDASGKIYADPTALFLMFDVEDESASLSQTILAMRDKQTEFADMWEFKTDANGRKYLLSKYPLVTQEGITMYSGVGTTIPSIYDGLPIDGVTIYWENGILKAQGGGGGTITEVTSAMVINALGYTPYDAKNPNGFITSSALNGYATQTWVSSQGYITGITSAMVTSALGFTPYNADNFTKAKIKSTLGISDWALAESKPSYNYTEIGGTPDLSVYALKTSLSSYQPLISTTNKLAYSLVSGTPTSLKNPTSLTFGSKTYDGSEAKTINASDLGALTSHQTIYALKLQSGTFSADTYTPNSAAKTINIPTTTSHISEGTNLYFTNARAVSALSSTLANYVTLGDSQTITGAKNFTGGLSVNGGSLVYNASEGYWKLEGNLLVTGGVAMYNSGNSDIPSGGGGGGSIEYPLSWSGFSSGSFDGSAAKTIYIPSKLSELTNDSGFLTSVSWSNISNKPTTLSGYGITDGDTWVRRIDDRSTNPSPYESVYTDRISWHLKYNETIGITTEGTYSGLLLLSPWSTSGGGSEHQLAFGTNGSIYHRYGSSAWNSWTKIVNETTLSSALSGYLPLSGGTISFTGNTPLSVTSTNGSWVGIEFTNKDSKGGAIGVNGSSPCFVLKDRSASYTLLHSNNYSSYALPLTGEEMKGDIKLPSGKYIRQVGGNNYALLGQDGDKIIVASPDYRTFIRGTELYFNGQTIIHSGNIGSQSVDSATKLKNARTLWGQSFDGSGNVSGDIYNFDGLNFKNGNQLYGYSDGSFGINITTTKNAIKVLTSGNVGIGASSPVTTLDVRGEISVAYKNNGGIRVYNQDRNNWSWIGNGVATGSDRANLIFADSTGEVIRIANGNVGIGITNPAYKLDVLATTNTTAYDLHYYNSSRKAALFVGYDQFWYGTSKANESSIFNINAGMVSDGSGGNSVFRILGNGNVGIGATSPSYKLHVEGTMYGNLKMKTPRTIWGQSFDGTGNVDGQLIINNNVETSFGDIIIYNKVGVNNGLAIGHKAEEYGMGFLKWKPTAANTSNQNNRISVDIYGHDNLLNILGNGNVGIGTTSPSYKLDVNGSLRVNGHVVYEATSGAKIGKEYTTTDTTLYNYIKFNGGTNGIQYYSGLWTGGNHAAHQFYTNGSTDARLTIMNNGNVGIGTTSPESTLHVVSSLPQPLTITTNGSSETAIMFYRNTTAKATVGYADGRGVFLWNITHGSCVCYNDSGYFGIGTVAPKYKLDVIGTFNASSNASIGGTLSVTGATTLSGGVELGSYLLLGSGKQIYSKNSSGATIAILTLSTSNNFHLGSDVASNGYDSYLEGNNIYLRYGTSRSTGMLLNSSGNVGIGTTSPQYKLDVSGDIATSQYLRVKAWSGYGGGICSMWYNGNNTTLVLDTGISFAHHCNVGSTLSVSSTSTFTGKTTHNGGLESTVSSAYAIYGNSSTSRVCIAGDNGKSLYIASKGNSADYYLVSVNYGQTTLGSGGSNAFTIRGDGNVGIGQNSPSAKLHVAGNILTSGSITMNSMRAMKNIINENGLSLEELSTIKPTRFTWKDGRDDRIHVGGIADDVMKVLPEVVFKGNDGVLSMDYASAAFVMTASLIKPITEHERRIANLERENALLKEEIRNLKSA